MRNDPRRSRLELKFDVLEAASMNPHITRILFKANTSWLIVKEVLSSLIELGLICNSGKEYRLTVKGEDILQAWRGIKDAMDGKRIAFFTSDRAMGYRKAMLNEETEK